MIFNLIPHDLRPDLEIRPRRWGMVGRYSLTFGLLRASQLSVGACSTSLRLSLHQCSCASFWKDGYCFFHSCLRKRVDEMPELNLGPCSPAGGLRKVRDWHVGKIHEKIEPATRLHNFVNTKRKGYAASTTTAARFPKPKLKSIHE